MSTHRKNLAFEAKVDSNVAVICSGDEVDMKNLWHPSWEPDVTIDYVTFEVRSPVSFVAIDRNKRSVVFCNVGKSEDKITYESLSRPGEDVYTLELKLNVTGHTEAYLVTCKGKGYWNLVDYPNETMTWVGSGWSITLDTAPQNLCVQFAVPSTVLHLASSVFSVIVQCEKERTIIQLDAQPATIELLFLLIHPGLASPFVPTHGQFGPRWETLTELLKVAFKFDVPKVLAWWVDAISGCRVRNSNSLLECVIAYNELPKKPVLHGFDGSWWWPVNVRYMLRCEVVANPTKLKLLNAQVLLHIMSDIP
jgi:hypothetical protein